MRFNLADLARPIVLLRGGVVAAAGVYVLVVMSGVGVLGGSPMTAASAVEYEYGRRVVLCHNGHTIAVDKKSSQMHFAHGDTPGACPP